MQIILSDNEIKILYNGLVLAEEQTKSMVATFGLHSYGEYGDRIKELKTRLKPYIKDGQ